MRPCRSLQSSSNTTKRNLVTSLRVEEQHLQSTVDWFKCYFHYPMWIYSVLSFTCSLTIVKDMNWILFLNFFSICSLQCKVLILQVSSLFPCLCFLVTVTDNGVAKRRVLTNLHLRHGGSPDCSSPLRMENSKWSCFLSDTWDMETCAGQAAETPQSYLDVICSSLPRLLVCCRGASVSVSVVGFLSNRQVEPDSDLCFYPYGWKRIEIG